jgi:hypothetical protein
MANPFVFSHTLLDANGIKTPVPSYFTPTTPSTVTVASLIVDWAGLGDVLDDATNAQIIGGKITIPIGAQGGWKTAPVDENDNSDVIVMNFNKNANRYAMEYLLPSFLQAMLINGKVDLANVALTALYDYLVATATAGQFTDTGGLDLVSLRDAFQTDRKSRKLRTKSIATPS